MTEPVVSFTMLTVSFWAPDTYNRPGRPVRTLSGLKPNGIVRTTVRLAVSTTVVRFSPETATYRREPSELRLTDIGPWPTGRRGKSIPLDRAGENNRVATRGGPQVNEGTGAAHISW